MLSKKERVWKQKDDRPCRLYAYGGYEHVADYFLYAVYHAEQTCDDGNKYAEENDKNITEEQQSKVKASQAITLLLAGGDKISDIIMKENLIIKTIHR